MSNASQESKKVAPILSRQQLQSIEDLFPHRVITHTASEAELREYMGVRKVIETLRRYTR